MIGSKVLSDGRSRGRGGVFRCARPGQGQGQGVVHRPAHRRHRGHGHRRPQLGRSRGAPAQRRPEGEIRIRADRARRRVQAERGGAGGDQGGGRPRHRRLGVALLLGRRHRGGRDLQPAGPADGGVGRGAPRHHLPQQVCRGAPGQRHHDQPERDRGEVHDRPRLQEVGVHSRHLRLRQGAQPVLFQVCDRGRWPDRWHVWRDRRSAGFHRRAHPGQDARSRGDLFRRAHSARHPHPLADGQGRADRSVRRAPPASSPTPSSRRSVRWRRARSPSPRVRRSRSCRAASTSRSSTTRPPTRSRRKPMAPSPSLP